MFPNIKSAYELVQTFPTEQKCIEFLEYMRWNNFPISPYDSDSKVYKCKSGRYKCKNTGKYFNVKTGTAFENTKISLRKWFLAIWLVTSHKKGISSIQLGKDIGVSQSTAWFMLQRIRSCFSIENESKLEGIVECDETFIGGKNKFRHKDKKVPMCQGRSYKDKIPVMGMLQRGGKLIAKVVTNTKAQTIQPLIYKYVKTNSYLMTDEWWAYRGLDGNYLHKYIDHSKKEYVNLEDNTIHTNNIEGSWNILKKSVSGMYNRVSKKHLQKYIDEFVFRYNLRNVSDYQKFKNLLLNSNVRTKYKDLIGCHS